MPTATNFSFTFPWKEMVGAFNALIGMVGEPIALLGAGSMVLLVIAILYFIFRGVVSMGRRG